MRRYFILYISFFVFLVAACTKDEMMDTQSRDSFIKISAQIDSTDPIARTSIGIDGKGKFVDGDIITLKNNDIQTDVTLTSGEWKPDLAWQESWGAQSDFSAFYPSMVNEYGRFVHAVQLDQNKGDNFEKSDLLYADPVTVNRGETVQLNFKHLMSCVTVVLQSNIFTDEELSKATVKMRGYNRIDVNQNGTLGKLHDYDYKYEKNNMSDFVFKHRGNGTYQLIICPQNPTRVAYSVWWLQIQIREESTGKSHEFNVSEPASDIRFESGQNTTLTYSFYDKDDRFANKTVWVDGLQGIPVSSSSAWKPIAVGSKLKYLPWKQEYGWYDCHKKDPAGPSMDDHNLCWAATTSNMIHWWMDRNSENIRKYCELNNKNFDVDIPHKYISHHDSEVFQLFRDKFEDKGGFVRQGLNWYFLGRYQRESDAANLVNPKVPSGGYFKDVFDVNSNMYVHRGIVDMASMNSAIKEALINKQAIGFAIWMSSFNGGHAMTIWGARFDDHGDVCAIYYVDNNDGPLNETPVGLIEARVGSYEGTKDISAEMRRRVYLENSYGQCTLEIQDMTFLDQRKSDWENYFRQHSK